MRTFISLLLVVCSVHLFSQERPFTANEKLWIDSINNLLGGKSPYFDSLMKANGKAHFEISFEARKNHDTIPDVFWGHANLYPHGRVPDDAIGGIGFAYYIKKKVIDLDCGTEIYLKKDGPVIAEFSYGIWGRQRVQTYSCLIRTMKDTLYNSNKTPGIKIISGIMDTTEKILIIPPEDCALVEGKIIGREIFRYKTYENKNAPIKRMLFNFAIESTISCTNNFFWQSVSKNNISLSVRQKQLEQIPGENLFIIKQRIHFDENDSIEMEYFQVDSILNISASQIEKIICLESNSTYNEAMHYPLSERMKYNFCVRGNSKKNDPDYLYHDPVARYLKRKNSRNNTRAWFYNVKSKIRKSKIVSSVAK